MNKKKLTERNICTKSINPAIEKAGWSMHKHVSEEVFFTDRRITVQGKYYIHAEKVKAQIIFCNTSLMFQ